jgi:ArsR family transcriptional regulator
MTTVARSELKQVSRWFQALSDPTRLEIILLLSEGERCVCDLTETLDAAQSRLSFHLKTLKTAGLVTDRREGRWVYYSLSPESLEAMAEFIREAKPVEGMLSGGARCCD